MLYKIDLYDCKEGLIVNDQAKVDYIIVDVNNAGEVREVISNRLVNTVSLDEDINRYVFNEEEKSRSEQDRYLCGMSPCIRTSDITPENRIHCNDDLGYNLELTKYFYSWDERYFNKYLNIKEENLNKSYRKR